MAAKRKDLSERKRGIRKNIVTGAASPADESSRAQLSLTPGSDAYVSYVEDLQMVAGNRLQGTVDARDKDFEEDVLAGKQIDDIDDVRRERRNTDVSMASTHGIFNKEAARSVVKAKSGPHDESTARRNYRGQRAREDALFPGMKREMIALAKQTPDERDDKAVAKLSPNSPLSKDMIYGDPSMTPEEMREEMEDNFGF